MSLAPGSAPPALEVFYDGGCPVCRREIGHQQRLAQRSGAPIRFVDVSGDGPGDSLPAGAPQRALLLQRFHVRHPDGRWEQGAAAFVALWARLPGWRRLAQVARWPGVLSALEWAYTAFLRLRPGWRQPAHCPVKRPGDPA
ncbi:MAG: DUF393 domain-containing protein [Inhella sp.]|uniref:thiol-disulfide oxidoreductase DCC family protein n=1 Tax=Inhella sp. TaxID=1921806 RepID=UPI0022BD4EF7|nr:DUF393 domain-containing protein [Inhella sp.]MCZ8235927.1 DUF393 domain-containing protein [Inhella sp.]